MSSYIRINQFIGAANQAYAASAQATASRYCLMADARGAAVNFQPLIHRAGAQVREENKHTWRELKQSLVGTLGQQKFDWICQRYRNHLNFSEMERSGRPLLPEHLELFSAGASQVLSRDIKACFPGKLRAVSRQQIGERLRSVQPFPVVGSYINPVTIPQRKTLYDKLFHNVFRKDKEKQLLFSDVANLSLPAFKERFSKTIVSRELIEGQIIPAPGRHGGVDYFKVYRKIAGDGLVAYALKPAASDSTLKPMLIFRPTQWALSNEDAIDSLRNDVQASIGELGWNANKTAFEQLMQDSHFRGNGEMIEIAGFSLGGVHAQWFLADHYENVSNAVFYNDPCLDAATADGFAERINRSPRRSEPLNMQIYWTNGDMGHCIGDKHIGCGVTHPDVNIQLIEVDHENRRASVFYLHSFRIFDNIHFPYRMQTYEDFAELNRRLDNTQRAFSIRCYEKVRSFSGTIAFISLGIFAEFIKFLSVLLGVRILRSSRDPD